MEPKEPKPSEKPSKNVSDTTVNFLLLCIGEIKEQLYFDIGNFPPMTLYKCM